MNDCANVLLVKGTSHVTWDPGFPSNGTLYVVLVVPRRANFLAYKSLEWQKCDFSLKSAFIESKRRRKRKAMPPNTLGKTKAIFFSLSFSLSLSLYLSLSFWEVKEGQTDEPGEVRDNFLLCFASKKLASAKMWNNSSAYSLPRHAAGEPPRAADPLLAGRLHWQVGAGTQPGRRRRRRPLLCPLRPRPRQDHPAQDIKGIR